MPGPVVPYYGIMRRALIAALLICRTALAADAPHAHIWFDARAPHETPRVRATVGGVEQSLELDTGSPHHAWSLKAAKARGVELRPSEEAIHDYAMRRHEAFRARLPVRVEGLALGPDEITVSDWTDELNPLWPDAPHVDGVLSPQTLAPTGGALVIDFVSGELTATSWPDALERIADRGLLIADVPAAASGHFVVAARVGRDELRLAVDTGAGGSLVWAARDLDTLGGATRTWKHDARLRVGKLMRDVAVQVLEPLMQPPFDGVLGMDVLRDCAIALDAHRLVARCLDDGRAANGDSTVSVMSPPPGARAYVCVREHLCLRETADGSYEYRGDRVTALFHKDGRFELKRFAEGGGLAMRSSRDELKWLLEETAVARYEQTHAWSLKRSFDFLPRHLGAVWADDHYTTAERRELLFRIWDEAAEPGDHELGAAGARARHVIERFVRHELPRGSPDGFTDEELSRFNARRRSDAPRFSPYERDPTDDGT
jgi:hypothetical protein